MTFLNKVVLITGAASGIGAATAIHFAKLEARLSLIDIDEEKLINTVKTCEGLSKTKVLKLKVDVANDEDVKAAIETTLKEFARIDVVVNCAGILGHGDILNPKLMENYDKVMPINLRAVVAITHYAAPALIETNGSIVNISSVSAEKPIGNISYCTSKAALSHFTRCVAAELGAKGVRVNAVLPGPVFTNLVVNSGASQEASDETFQGCADASPLGQVVPAEQVAEAVAYLASERASCICGVTLPIDSGLLLSSGGAVQQLRKLS